MSRVPASYLVRFAQLAALWAYAVSQQVFSLLQGNPEFLVVRGATRAEVVVFALALSLAPPAAALVCESIASIFSARLGRALHLAFIGAFAFPLGLYLVAQLEPEVAGAVFGAVAISLAIVNAYALWRPFRLFLTYSVLLPLLGLGAFIVDTPLATADAAGASVDPASKPSIVMLVLDEFPVSSLMNAEGDIDRVRYPNFARLADEGTWYPRATSVHEHTTGAVPAILTGRLPVSGELPTLEDHPRNLFTMLGESYRFRVAERITHLCPKRYCPIEQDPLLARLRALFDDTSIGYLHRVLPASMARGLPSIGDAWGDFSDNDLLLAARDAEDVDRILTRPLKPTDDGLDSFLAAISAEDSRGTLHFLHLLLPHTPWRYLPSGRQYGQAELVDGAADQWNEWGGDARLVEQGYQRHLLQVGYTDAVVGRLLARLDRQGLYDESLVVVVADHGASFVPRGTRRTVSRENIADIGRVPLFIKFPSQERGRVDRRAVRTIDVVPTVADSLDMGLNWDFDGRSLTRRVNGSSIVAVSRRDGTFVRATVREVDRAQASTIRRKQRLFGAGPDSLYRLGVNRHLLDRTVESLSRESSNSGRVNFDGETLLGHVRKASRFIPVRITGTIEGIAVPPRAELAVAVNGRIAALSPCFSVNTRQRFSALVTESTLRDGYNDVALYLIAGPRGSERLIELGRTRASERYVLAADAQSIALPGGPDAVVNDDISGRIERWGTVNGTLRLRGWALDLDGRALPDRILVFAGRRNVYAGETTVFRWDIRPEDGLERSGWTVDVPEHEVRGRVVRVFALRGEIASELPLSPNVQEARRQFEERLDDPE